MHMMTHFEVEISCLGLTVNGALPDSLTSAPTSLGGVSGEFSILRFEEQVRGENETIQATKYVAKK